MKKKNKSIRFKGLFDTGWYRPVTLAVVLCITNEVALSGRIVRLGTLEHDKAGWSANQAVYQEMVCERAGRKMPPSGTERYFSSRFLTTDRGTDSVPRSTGSSGSGALCHFPDTWDTNYSRRNFSASSQSPVPSHGQSKKQNMLDTIRVKASLPVLSDREQELQRNESTAWVNRSERLFHSHTKDLQETIRSYHRESGFYASVCDGTIRKAQGSMARLVHGSNGIQIKSPEELSRGRCAYLSHLAFLNNRVREDDLKLTRVDLALNLHLDPRKVLGIHRIAKHPMIHRETEEYYNTPPEKRWSKGPHMLSKLSTLRFHGTKTTISVYDKVREVLGRKQGEWPENSHCTRVEIQLHTAKHVAKHLGFEGREFITLDQLDFEMCYQAFRRILMRFEEQGGVLTFQPSLASDLAILERHPETWDTIGMRPLDWYYSTGVSERRFREVLNQVRKTHLELHDFRWGEVLSKDRLPDIIDIDESGQEYLVRSPWFFG